MAVTKEYIFKEGKEYDVCTNCQLKNCIKQMLPNFMNIVDYYNTKVLKGHPKYEKEK